MKDRVKERTEEERIRSKLEREKEQKKIRNFSAPVQML